MTQATLHLVESLKQHGQDHEFYPTTRPIIDAMLRDFRRTHDDWSYSRRSAMDSVLDIGAGNGKVLAAFREDLRITKLFAIEHSQILRDQLPADVLIVGTDFREQSLLSKQVGVVFCNPPYSEFEAWTEKIIRECAAPLAYLVIPERWTQSTPIADAIRYREAKATSIGDFTFENGEDRTARARVQLLRIEFAQEKDDAFDRFFREQFHDLYEKFSAEKPAEETPGEADRKSRFSSLVIGPTYPEALVELYTQEMAHVQKNYAAVAELDPDLMREFDISPQSILNCLKARLTGLRTAYWRELFDHLDTITDRLTGKSRNALLATLNEHVHVDFTLDNIFAVVLWVIKNANNYLESQFLQTYEKLVEKCNVQFYKSNQRTWQQGRWRYGLHEDDPNSHYALDYRIVLHYVGGVAPRWSHCGPELADSAAELLRDLHTIARNLGFTPIRGLDPRIWGHSPKWTPGESETFRCYDERREDNVTLMEVKGFKNGNLHIRMNKDFMLALNVEWGRLKGWIRDGAEAASELDDPNAAQFFGAHHRITAGDCLLLKAA